MAQFWNFDKGSQLKQYWTICCYFAAVFNDVRHHFHSPAQLATRRYFSTQWSSHQQAVFASTAVVSSFFLSCTWQVPWYALVLVFVPHIFAGLMRMDGSGSCEIDKSKNELWSWDTEKGELSSEKRLRKQSQTEAVVAFREAQCPAARWFNRSCELALSHLLTEGTRLLTTSELPWCIHV